MGGRMAGWAESGGFKDVDAWLDKNEPGLTLDILRETWFPMTATGFQPAAVSERSTLGIEVTRHVTPAEVFGKTEAFLGLRSRHVRRSSCASAMLTSFAESPLPVVGC